MSSLVSGGILVSMRSQRLPRLPSLLALRASILATMGVTACGGSVAVPGGGGSGGGTTTTTDTTPTTGTTTGTTGTTTTGTTTTGTTTTTTTTPPPTECAGAVPVPAADGSPSGFSRCPDGTLHRNQAVACNPTTGVTPCQGTETLISCKDDAECPGAHGRCASVITSTFGGATTACECISPCADDAECGPDLACVCAGVIPNANGTSSFCAPATCLTGADCPSGECGASIYDTGCWTDVQLACRGPNDVCRNEADCGQQMGTTCAVPAPGEPWGCLPQGCAVGRPLIVDGAARTADAVGRSDWTTACPAPRLDELTAAAREAVATHWLDVAALEHASIASFARFTLELLALGAPSHLLADAQRAGLDEVEHARLAYAIASAYAGRQMGPDGLDLVHVPIRADRREVIRSLVAEACIGETLGVAEAIELASAVVDPAIAKIHARIALDEQRHAELAWRTLAWLLDGADEETLRFTARCFDDGIAAASDEPPARDRAIPEHGVLASSTIATIRRRALADVVRPCADALLDRPRSASIAAQPAAVT
jgi:hypothetical protein